jgi:hypothetical protein
MAADVILILVVVGIFVVLLRMNPKKLTLKIVKLLELSAEAGSTPDEAKPPPPAEPKAELLPPADEPKALPKGTDGLRGLPCCDCPIDAALHPAVS